MCGLCTQKSGNSSGREACWNSRCIRLPRSTRAWRCKVVERLSERGPICDVDSSGCLAYHLAWCTRCWHAWSLFQRCASYLRSEECYGRYSDRPGPGDPKSGHREKYARMRVVYYVIYDPLQQVMPDVLTIYRLSGTDYERQSSPRFPDIGLGVTLWDGTYEGKTDTWLRWTDADGNLVLTGKERAEQEHQRAEQERLDKEQTLQQLEQERQRADRLAALLRQLGHDPGQL